MLTEIRLEKAMAAELAATANIIKKTGIFDSVDRIYGDYEAMNNPQAQQAQAEGDEEGLGGGGGGFGGGDFGGDMDMDLGEPGSSDEGDLGGDMGETDMDNAPGADVGEPLMENSDRRLRMITEKKKRDSFKPIKTFTKRYFDMLEESLKDEREVFNKSELFNEQIVTINHTINEICENIDSLVNEEEFKNECLIDEVINDTKILEE